MKLGECKVIRAHGRPSGVAESRALTADEIKQLSESTGELRRGGEYWASDYGKTPGWSYVAADIEPGAVDEPAFNPNTSPKDSSGRPLTPGDYEVRHGSDWRLATVFEDGGDLLVRFEGSDRTQRVDECATTASWQRITATNHS